MLYNLRTTSNKYLIQSTHDNYSLYDVYIRVHEFFCSVVVDGVGGKQSGTTEAASNMSQRQTSIISDTRTVMQGLDTLRNEHKQVSTY